MLEHDPRHHDDTQQRTSVKGHLPAITRRLQGILILIGLMWGVMMLNSVLHRCDLTSFGLRPRTLWGLLGIVTMPWLHSQVGHLAANTAPLLILLTLLAASKPRFWETLVELVLASGGLLWLVGRSDVHVGSDSLIYGLVSFLILTGLLEKKTLALLVSFAVGFCYGGMLLWGVIPGLSPAAAWDGNLAGALAGALLACALTFDPRSRPRGSREG